MKRREMEQHMADGTSVGVKRDQYSQVREAKILEVGVTRRVYSSARWDFAGHNAHDGVRIKYVGGTESEEVVGARAVGDWEAMASAEQRRRDQAQERADRLASLKARCEEQVARLGLGEVRASYGGRYQSTITGWYVHMTPGMLELLERKETT